MTLGLDVMCIKLNEIENNARIDISEDALKISEEIAEMFTVAEKELQELKDKYRKALRAGR
ncbi:MAG: hypothetical protein HYV28_18875 [Ignavibacteriales bacterium]|nr:hypothetical protein [Ignavibacteriales bacterium]